VAEWCSDGVMADGVVFRHTVEAFIDRVILRRGLLSLEFDKELKALGLDVSRPVELSVTVWISVLRACARRLLPAGTEAEGLELVGREMLRGYLEGLVGKSLFMLLRMLGPRRALLRIMESYRTADNVTTIKATERAPNCVDLEFNNAFEVPTYVRGLVLEAMPMLGAREPKVEFRLLPSGVTVFTASWT
jgi:uncharacterized protein (TIGR02265 family)